MRETPRIRITGDAIEFRPVRLSDQGSYNCMKNDDIASTYSSELTVSPRGMPFYMMKIESILFIKANTFLLIST